MTTSGRKFGRGKMPLFFFVRFVLMMFIGGLVVMLLWNAIIPDIFNLKSITYWQSVGLILLTRILTGGFKSYGRFGNGHYGGPPPHLRDKWKNMTNEEREAFRAQWKRRCEEKKAG